MKILHLTIKRQWLDMILSGVKLEDYREINPWNTSRLANRKYDAVEFSNGYGQVPKVLVELLGIHKGRGRLRWGAPEHDVYVLCLGDILNVVNYQRKL